MSQYDLIPYRGRSLMFWALEWFRMSNDAFFKIYGFNFNPHEYPGLYEAARDRKYREEEIQHSLQKAEYQSFLRSGVRGEIGLGIQRGLIK